MEANRDGRMPDARPEGQEASGLQPPAAEARPAVALILCGALAREVIEIVRRNGWNVALFGVAALDHMLPARIAPDVERRLRELIPKFDRVIVVYGDCGTAGRLDGTLERYNVPRVAGPHCYEMYGGETFEAIAAETPGTFFLTDFLVRSFEGTVLKGLGLDRYPFLKDDYFRNYTQLVYLVQNEDPGLLAKAERIAEMLGLPLQVRRTGYNLLEARLTALMSEIHDPRYRPILPPAEEGDDGKLPDSLLARHPRTGSRARLRRARERGAAGSLPERD